MFGITYLTSLALLPLGLRLTRGYNYFWFLFKIVFQRLRYSFLKVVKPFLFGCLLFDPLATVLTKTGPQHTKNNGTTFGISSWSQKLRSTLQFSVQQDLPHFLCPVFYCSVLYALIYVSTRWRQSILSGNVTLGYKTTQHTGEKRESFNYNNWIICVYFLLVFVFLIENRRVFKLEG